MRCFQSFSLILFVCLSEALMGFQSTPISAANGGSQGVDSGPWVEIPLRVTARRPNGDAVAGLRAEDFQITLNRIPVTVVSAQPYPLIEQKSDPASIERVNVLILLEPEIGPNSWIIHAIEEISKEVRTGTTALWSVTIVDPNAHIWPATTDQTILEQELGQIKEEKFDPLHANAWDGAGLTAWRSLRNSPGRRVAVYHPRESPQYGPWAAWSRSIADGFELYILQDAPPQFPQMRAKDDTIYSKSLPTYRGGYVPLSYRSSFHDAFKKINADGPGTYNLLLRSNSLCGAKLSCVVLAKEISANVNLGFPHTIGPSADDSVSISSIPAAKPYHSQLPVPILEAAGAPFVAGQTPAIQIGTWLFPNFSKKFNADLTAVIAVSNLRNPAGKISVDLLLLDGNGTTYLVERRVSSSTASGNIPALVLLSEYDLPAGNYAVAARSLDTGETAVAQFKIYPRLSLRDLYVSTTMLSTGCSTVSPERALTAQEPNSEQRHQNLFSPLNQGACEWVPLLPKTLHTTSTLYARLVLYTTMDRNAFNLARWTVTCTVRRANGDVVIKKNAKITTGRYKGWEVVQSFDPVRDRLQPGAYSVEFTLNGPERQSIKSGDVFMIER